MTKTYTEDEIRLMLSRLGWLTKEVEEFLHRVKFNGTWEANKIRVASYRPKTGMFVIRHQYDADDRCVCGGEVVYHEDTNPPGHGCSIYGYPWDLDVRMKDPQARVDDARIAHMDMSTEEECER